MVAFCAVRVGDDARSPRFHRILFVGEEVSYVVVVGGRCCCCCCHCCCCCCCRCCCCHYCCCCCCRRLLLFVVVVVVVVVVGVSICGCAYAFYPIKCMHHPYCCASMYLHAIGRGHEKGASSPREERRVRGVRGSIGRGSRIRLGCRSSGGRGLRLNGAYAWCC